MFRVWKEVPDGSINYQRYPNFLQRIPKTEPDPFSRSDRIAYRLVTDRESDINCVGA